MNGIRPGKTTKTRDKDYESTNISYKLNQSQLLSEIGSDRSQPKSGNDSWRRIDCGGQEKGAYSGRLKRIDAAQFRNTVPCSKVAIVWAGR